jgi:hypothetical protein
MKFGLGVEMIKCRASSILKANTARAGKGIARIEIEQQEEGLKRLSV